VAYLFIFLMGIEQLQLVNTAVPYTPGLYMMTTRHAVHYAVALSHTAVALSYRYNTLCQRMQYKQ